MSNEKLIERLRRWQALETAGIHGEAAGALELADKRIAELEADYSAMSHLAASYLGSKREAERKLDVAREALKQTTDVLETLRRGHGTDVGAACFPALNVAREALAQIGEK